MTGELVRKTELSRKRIYRKMGLTEKERKRMEAYLPKDNSDSKISSVKKTGGFLSSVFSNKKNRQKEGGPVLTDKQKRRNVFESRRSSEEVGDKVGSIAGTGYQQSNIGFGGGDVEVSHRVSSLKTSEQISGKGFARKVEDPHKSNRANAGFARDISEGIEGGRGSSPKRPIGF
jgi:hypothetical protein